MEQGGNQKCPRPLLSYCLLCTLHKIRTLYEYQAILHRCYHSLEVLWSTHNIKLFGSFPIQLADFWTRKIERDSPQVPASPILPSFLVCLRLINSSDFSCLPILLEAGRVSRPEERFQMASSTLRYSEFKFEP
jgi:hypothetical protein